MFFGESIELRGANGKIFLSIPPGISSNLTWKFPSSYGSSGQFIQVDGAGQMSTSGVAFSDLTGTPTTLSGYGITDAVPSSRTISVTTGLSGGGSLAANRTIGLNFAGLSEESSPSQDNDFVVIVTAAGTEKKVKIANMPTGEQTLEWTDILNKPTTVAGYSIIDAVTTSTGVYGQNGLSGGGTLEQNRYISLAINGLSSYPSTPSASLQMVVENGGTHYKTSVGNLFTLYEVQSGYGTSGGGLLSTSPTIELALGDLNVKSSGLSASWYLPIVETDNTQWKSSISTVFGLFSVSTGSGLTGGGALSSNPSIGLNINGLTEDSSPSSTDYLLEYDVSAGYHRKVKISNLPISGGGGGWTITERTGSGDEDFYPGSGTELVNMNKPSGNMTVWLPSSGQHVIAFRTGGGYMYVKDPGGLIVATLSSGMAYAWFSWIGSQWVKLITGTGS